MKKKHINLMMMAAFALASASCTDFLTEDNKTGVTADLEYQTLNGIDGLANSAYAYTRGWWGKEPSIGLAECAGTDLFYIGYDCKQASLASYNISSLSYGFSSTSGTNAVNDNPCFDQYWELFYAGIDMANNLLVYTDQCSALTEKQKAQYLADGYFLRALYYSQLVAMFGPIPYNTEPISQNTNYSPVRVPEKEVYKHILDDLKLAQTNYETAGINNSAKATQGHGSLYAAKALYAREALYAASWLGENSVEGYDNLYQVALDASKEVIANSGASLYSRYSDTWNMNNEEANKNSENLYAVHYDADLTTYTNCVPYRTYAAGSSRGEFNSLLTRTGYTRGGSAQLLMFNPLWNNGCSDLGGNGVDTTCVFVRALKEKENFYITSKTTGDKVRIAEYYSPYGRGFARFTPSLYLWSELEKVRETDQRCDATILTHYNVPKDLAGNAKNYPNMADQEFKDYEEAYAKDGNYFNGGGYAIRYSILDGSSEEGKKLQAEAKGKYRLQFAYYSAKADSCNIPVYTSGVLGEAEPTTAAVKKSAVYGDARYNDAKIGGNASFPGIKKFLDDQFNKSYPTHDISSRDCMVLRLAEMYLIKAEAEMATGSSAAALSTINELREKRAISGKDNSIQSVYGESSVDIETILRERALELCGEYQRWFDLKRTHTLLDHVKKYNAQAKGNIDKCHYYRPIPETELNSVSNYIGASPYSQDDKGVLQYTTKADGMWQNPGY